LEEAFRQDVDDKVVSATSIKDEIATEMRLVSHMRRLEGWTGDFCVAARSYRLKAEQ
jgi:hypothetical protein